jgi:hypothetical protein
MSISKLMTGVAAVLALAGTAFGTTYRSSQTGAWNDQSSWEYEFSAGVWHGVKADGMPVPGTGDVVTITSGNPITVSAANANVGQVTVAASAALTINSTYSLTMDTAGTAGISGTMTVSGTFYSGSSGSVIIYSGGLVNINSGLYSASSTTTINGGAVLQLSGSSPQLALNNADAVVLPDATSALWVETSGSFTGSSGSIRGQNNSAGIFIGPASGSATAQLSNYCTIIGALTIQKYNTGTADFANVTSGSVMADAGTLTLDSSLGTITARTNDASGSANAQWQSINGAIFVFNRAVNTSPARYFYVSGSSTLTVNAAFAGSGINSTYGTVNGSQSTYFLANTPTY